MNIDAWKSIFLLRHRSIATRLSAAFSLLISIIALLILYHVPGQLASREYAVLNARTQTIAQMTAFSISPSLVFQDSAGAVEVVAAALQDSNIVRVRVLTVGGGLFLEYDTKVEVRQSFTTAAPIVHNGVEIGTVQLDISLDDLHAHLDTLRQRILATSLIVYILGILTVFGISRLITRPLRAMAEVAEDVTRGAWGNRVPITSHDETGVLARALNTMLERIETMQSGLARMNAELEDRVREKTEGLQREIILHKHTLAALAREQEFNRAVFDTDPSLIYVKDTEDCFVLLNTPTATFFGRSVAELTGKKQSQYFEALGEKGGTHDLELHVLRTGSTLILDEEHTDHLGRTRWFATSRTPLKTPEGINNVLVIATDITDRRNAEDSVRASLHEKELLLKEIHHRVKNNMQVISSLLNLQSTKIDNQENRDIFNQSISRIRSMALVHERLYHTANLASIDFGEYVSSLTAELARGSARLGVRCAVTCAPIHLGIDTAIPCGLILNELVSNALKHGFPHGRAGCVRVDIHRGEGGMLNFSVHDDGVGFPEELDFLKTKSLGMQLVNSLVKQLDGSLTMRRNHGTEFIVALTEKTTEPQSPAPSP